MREAIAKDHGDTDFFTFTGRRIDILQPRADAIDICDIARGLANANRYAGHLRVRAHSVAAHSVDVSNVLRVEKRDVRTQLAGLLHDAAEAYLGDLTSPLKRALRYLHGNPIAPSPFDDLEDRWLAAIGERFGVELVPMPDVVMAADAYVFRSEDALMRGNAYDFGERGVWPVFRPPSAWDAESSFLSRAEELLGEEVRRV